MVIKDRSEIEEKYKWDLSGYAENLDSALLGIKDLKKKYEKLEKYEGKLSDDDLLFECLENERMLDEKFDALTCYCSLRQKENSADAKVNEVLNIIESMTADLSVKLSFIDVEISKFSYVRLKKLISNPKFIEYKEMFEDVLRHKKHVLSKSQEKLLSQVGEFAGGQHDVFSMFDSCDVTFEDVVDSKGKKYPMSNATYSRHVESEDKVLRRSAYVSMMNAYGKFNKTLFANYLNAIKTDCAYAKIRKYKSAIDQALYNEQVPKIVYDKLIKNVHEALEEFYKYFDLKKKMLGLEKFCICDSYAKSKATGEFTFEEAFEIIKKALSVLGEDYVKMLNEAKQQRWVDVFPNKGKETGAFSSGAYRKNPIILMNFVGDLNSVFTLAHELGHSIHTKLANTHQNSINADYPIFLAEIASTTNEIILLSYLLKNAKSDDEKIYYIDTFLGMTRATIFRQTMFAEFEQIVHELYEKREPLSFEVLNKAYQNLNKLYFGKNVEVLECSQFEWSRIPHFYNSFYVYKYATGFICAIHIANRAQSDKTYAKKYLQMLSMGGKLPGVEVLKTCDIDMAKDEVYDNAFSVVSRFIKQFETLLK